MKETPVVVARAVLALVSALALVAPLACAPPGGGQVEGRAGALSPGPSGGGLFLAHAARVEARAAGGPEASAGSGDVFVRRGDVFVRGVDGEERLTRGEDRFYGPLLSPDGSLVAVVGLRTGLHVLDASTGRPLAHAGPRTSHPSWTPDGRWLVYERVEDDGHALTAGDLEALAPRSGGRVRLTESSDAIETAPAVSPDGGRLAFVRDGADWVADLVEVGP